MAEFRCGACGRRFTDPRHDHPHDYVGSLEAFNGRQPCLACNRVHDSQPDAVARLQLVGRPCPCGSGLESEEVCDARGIYVARVCDACRQERLAGFRPEIFTDASYDADEPIDAEECVWPFEPPY